MENIPIEESCYTHVDLVKLRYKWVISNFKVCAYFREDLECSFSARSNNEMIWSLILYPQGSDENSKDYLSLFLKLVSCSRSQIEAISTFSILNSMKEKTNTKELEPTVYVLGEEFGYAKFIKKDFLFDKDNGLLCADELTIICDIDVLPNNGNIYHQISSNVVHSKVHTDEYKLSEELGILFDNLKFCDVTLDVLGRELQAHKAILAARSNVFAAMFEHKMIENELNRVVINDIEYDVLQEMLRFIYTGKAPNLNVMAYDLLAAADKYALKDLKTKCEEALFVKLCVETAAETLILADLHSADKLKAKSIDFITTHFSDVLETQTCQNMIATHPSLISELLRALLTLLPRSAS